MITWRTFHVGEAMVFFAMTAFDEDLGVESFQPAMLLHSILGQSFEQRTRRGEVFQVSRVEVVDDKV